MLGDEWLPVLPVEQFLSHLSDQRRSPNTVKAYAHDLKDYFDHFGRRGLAWDRLPYDELAAFKPWLRRGRPATITAHQWRHAFATGLINGECGSRWSNSSSITPAWRCRRTTLGCSTPRSAASGRPAVGWTTTTATCFPPKLSGPTGPASRCRTAPAHCPASKPATTPTSACPARFITASQDQTVTVLVSETTLAIEPPDADTPLVRRTTT